jgi:RNA polymerase sigma-70 factor (ECF subfamily)
MEPTRTTQVVQLYLDELGQHAGQGSAAPVVRDLLEAAAKRLQHLCAGMLYRSYPRLAQPPFNLELDEVLSAVVERLMKALHGARPGNVRQFFALANMHMRWELNDFARKLDARTSAVPIREESAAAPTEASEAAGAIDTLRILEAIEALPEDQRECFSLVRIQGLTHAEAAELLGVSTKSIQRRLNRSLIELEERLGDLKSGRGGDDEH